MPFSQNFYISFYLQKIKNRGGEIAPKRSILTLIMLGGSKMVDF